MNDIETTLMRLSGHGYCCSQIMILLALEMQGRDNQELVRAVSGLCNGVGLGAGTCGALTGAACVLGMYAGKGRETESADNRLPVMLADLSEWFADQACSDFPGIRCEDILGGPARKPDLPLCGRLVMETWNRTLKILLQEGFDPAASGREP